jgi:hypothetical protein
MLVERKRRDEEDSFIGGPKKKGADFSCKKSRCKTFCAICEQFGVIPSPAVSRNKRCPVFEVCHGEGRGAGVGLDLGIGVTRGVELGVAVVVAVAVGVGPGRIVAVPVGVAVAVAVEIGVNVAVAEGVGVGVAPDCAQYLPPVFR